MSCVGHIEWSGSSVSSGHSFSRPRSSAGGEFSTSLLSRGASHEQSIRFSRGPGGGRRSRCRPFRAGLAAGPIHSNRAWSSPAVGDRVPAESGRGRHVSPHLGGAAAPRRNRAHPCRPLRGSRPHRRERVILQWLDGSLTKGARVAAAGATLACRSKVIAVTGQIAVASLSSRK
jgi:hypothetical protein